MIVLSAINPIGSSSCNISSAKYAPMTTIKNSIGRLTALSILSSTLVEVLTTNRPTKSNIVRLMMILDNHTKTNNNTAYTNSIKDLF
jgi:hypothetical protein